MIRMNNRDITGVLVVDKSKGPTSHDIIASLRRVLQMRRIGHCGTLDPLASGVLVVCLGNYTRLNRWLSDADKEYNATLCLGATSVTGDAQGPIAESSGYTIPDASIVAEKLRGFCGEIEQVPHAYSAIKVDGVRSYKKARRGEEVELKARRINIYKLELVSYEFPKLVIRVHCSSGTYIRSLAADLGASLGVGAYLAELQRTRVGQLGLDRALTLNCIATMREKGNIEDAFAPPRQALGEFASIELNKDRLVDFTHGKSIEDLPSPVADAEKPCAVFDASENLYGIAHWDKGALRPFCVLRQTLLVA